MIKFVPSERVNIRGKQGETRNVSLFISAGLNKPLKITPQKFSLEGKINYSLDVVEKGKKYKISFWNNPDVKGHFYGYLRLGTNYKEKPEITIRIDSRFN